MIDSSLVIRIFVITVHVSAYVFLSSDMYLRSRYYIYRDYINSLTYRSVAVTTLIRFIIIIPVFLEKRPWSLARTSLITFPCIHGEPWMSIFGEIGQQYQDGELQRLPGNSILEVTMLKEGL